MKGGLQFGLSSQKMVGYYYQTRKYLITQASIYQFQAARSLSGPSCFLYIYTNIF